ncbi:FliH/SctL family protein [Paracoccus litorisediminis]|uniref:FliH/SctL family protein n=1 Tax=Paracoccus litorisediminis TaxID=2006130 RepID=UPI00372EAFEF
MMVCALFSRDFDAEIEAEAQAQARHNSAPPAQSEEEIEVRIVAARDEGYTAGHEAGRAEAAASAAASFDARLAAAVETLPPLLDNLLKGVEAHRAQVEEDLGNLLLSICEKAIPLTIEKHGRDHLLGELRRIVRRAQGSRWLEVRTHPEEAGNIRMLVQTLLDAAGMGRELRVIGDQELDPGEVRALWHNGRSSWSQERIGKMILATLAGESNSLAAKKE